MSSGKIWPVGYEKTKTLKISTVGRRTGKAHTTTIEFAVDADGRFYIATRDRRRDWVKNAKKNPSVAISLLNVTRKMKVVQLKSEAEKLRVANLYRKKYLMARVVGLFRRGRSPWYDAFELKAE